MVENTDARDAVGDYRYGFHDPENHTIRFDSGLSEQVVRDISELKNEPEWMTEIRVKAYHHFVNRPTCSSSRSGTWFHPVMAASAVALTNAF